eukprot:CAMPEP_0115596518 /NCGR_PEP_ID=MMETSP0272-20121206/12877_1 /TAXON_ID=71861 /ORGANISM="Scrippsiella trochoidea, Strain CCMP3099" /LENGTH=91 /DNA_ID=CAMNT_0003031859 /DNA_START=281 /DNA_END=557 /DNA_ORIENTATION=+
MATSAEVTSDVKLPSSVKDTAAKPAWEISGWQQPSLRRHLNDHIALAMDVHAIALLRMHMSIGAQDFDLAANWQGSFEHLFLTTSRVVLDD